MATNIKVEIEGNTSKFLEKASTNTLLSLDKLLLQSAFKIDATAKKEIQTGNRTGKEYKRGRGRSAKRGRRSAPGEYPKTDRGSLVRSIRVKQQDFLNIEVGSTVNHGKFLEEGTRFMQPRPFLEPSLKKELPKMNSNVEKTVGRSFKIAQNKAR